MERKLFRLIIIIFKFSDELAWQMLDSSKLSSKISSSNQHIIYIDFSGVSNEVLNVKWIQKKHNGKSFISEPFFRLKYRLNPSCKLILIWYLYRRSLKTREKLRSWSGRAQAPKFNQCDFTESVPCSLWSLTAEIGYTITCCLQICYSTPWVMWW